MTRSAWLADHTWPEVERRAARGAVLAVPIGSTEQHGPHLPLSTDTDVAVELCSRLAARRGGVLIAPPLPYGSSGEHAGFAGTISIGQAATELILLELGRSAFETFHRVLFVSAHGGNAEPVARATQQLRAEGRDVVVYSPSWEGELHAGATETSMQLALAPDRVTMSAAETGDTRSLPALMTTLRTGGIRAVSPNGILGDPTRATAADGDELLTRFVDELDALVHGASV